MSSPLRRRRALAALAVAAVVLPTLAACTAAVPLTAADAANDPACAQVTVHLPEVVGEDERRETDAQATGAWGSPTSVLLRCGVESPAVSDDPCYSVAGVDWISSVDPDDPDTGVLRTFGRVPGLEVIVDTTKASSGTVAQDLSTAAGYLPQDGAQCLDAADVPLEGSDGAPEPTD